MLMVFIHKQMPVLEFRNFFKYSLKNYPFNFFHQVLNQQLNTVNPRYNAPYDIWYLRHRQVFPFVGRSTGITKKNISGELSRFFKGLIMFI